MHIARRCALPDFTGIFKMDNIVERLKEQELGNSTHELKWEKILIHEEIGTHLFFVVFANYDARDSGFYLERLNPLCWVHGLHS